MRVIVCGTRDWEDQLAVSLALGEELIKSRAATIRSGSPPLTVRHGACYPSKDKDGNRPLRSADWLAELWCLDCAIKSEPMPADWNKYGCSAGPRRNAEMAKAGADLCIAFWDGNSKGTADMIRRAVQCGIEVRIVPKARV